MATFFSLSNFCAVLSFFLSGYSLSAQAFISTWNSDIYGGSNKQIVIPATGSYNIDWFELANPSNSGSLSAIGETIVTFPSPGIYQVNITGGLVSLRFGSDWSKSCMELLSIEQWGNIGWTDMESAFEGCENLEINANDNPDLSLVTSFRRAFFNIKAIHGNIGGWDVSTITDMYNTFCSVDINQDLNSWDVSNVTTMGSLFAQTPFNGDITAWDVSNVTDMYGMFIETPFNQPIGNWDVSSVTDMNYMFGVTPFNQDITNWDVSSVVDMSHMFAHNVVFNQPIGSWNTSSLKHIQFMFESTTAFNQDISSWDVSGVEYFHYAFVNASSFDQDLSAWQVSQVISMASMFDHSGMSIANYDATLIGWFNQGLPDNIQLGAFGLEYCAALSVHNTLTGSKGWTIQGDALNCALNFHEDKGTTANVLIEKPLACYPNPWDVSNEQFLKVKNINHDEALVSVFNVLGDVVYSELLSPHDGVYLIDHSKLMNSTGMHVVKVSTRSQVYTTSVVVE